MKLVLSCVFLLVLGFTKPAHAGITDIPLKRQVILNPLDSPWRPTQSQVEKCLPIIQAYLERRKDSYILTRTPGYFVQFWGVLKDGKRAIFCNFFRPHGNWRGTKVVVEDGGCDFWRATCDSNGTTVLAFDCNGWAHAGRYRSGVSLCLR